MKIYVLKSGYNGYDQYGELFENAYRDVPTKEELKKESFNLNDKEYNWMLIKLKDEGVADFHNPDSFKFDHIWPIIEVVEI